MQEMKDLIMWFLTQLPAFLMAEPICYFVGFGFLFCTLALFQSICNFGRSRKF